MATTTFSKPIDDEVTTLNSKLGTTTSETKAKMLFTKLNRTVYCYMGGETLTAGTQTDVVSSSFRPANAAAYGVLVTWDGTKVGRATINRDGTIDYKLENTSNAYFTSFSYLST